MDITSLGHSSFKLRGKTTTIVTDPYDSAMVGLKFPKHTTADIVTISHDHPDHNSVLSVEGSPFVVRGPGEYEIKGVGIIGISVFHDNEQGTKRGKNIMYRMEIDGISVVHVGDLGHTLDNTKVEELDGVDVLMIPVGGFYTISAQEAASVISEIEPALVIPMHYGRPELDKKSFSALTPLSIFLKEMGKEDIVPVSKIVITKDKLPQEMQVVVLSS